MHTLKFTLTIPLLALLFPALALAGSQSYTTPGTYTFTVPQYTGTLTVTVNGAGGGGGGGGGGGVVWAWGGGIGDGPISMQGSNGGVGWSGGAGGASSFENVTANEGGGGTGGTGGTGSGSPGLIGSSGASGSASGGNPNSTGGGAAGGGGGTGGAGGCAACHENTGYQNLGINDHGGMGGNGGAGGRAVKTYSVGQLEPGSSVIVVVGEGGVGGRGGNSGGPLQGATDGFNGSSGSSGSISITWTDVAAPQQNSCNTNTAIYGTPGNYTFTVPSGVTQVRVFVSGAGGGGGAGSGGWGSGGGGGCSGAIAGGTMTVTPGQKIPLYVGYGGTGGNGTNQTGMGGCPWCGTYDPSSNGSTGGASGIASITAQGGSWGRTGYYNLFNQNPGGTGGGSGGGGGGNGWPGFYGASGNGGTAGGQTNSQGSGGYCTGGGWSINPATFITKVPYATGAGGYAPGNYTYWGGGGGGGVVINNSTVNGGDGASSPNNGGKGYGGGGGGSNVDYRGPGGVGAQGLVYLEWDNRGASDSCALSCSVTFAQNPLTGNSTTIRWTSQNASLFYINNVGYVGASGSAQVSSPGDYSGEVSGIGASVSCPATLRGTGDNASCTSTSQICQANGTIRNSCGKVTACRYGCSITTNKCNNPLSCEPYRACDAEGNKVVNSCDGSTVDDCSAQGRACVAGQCILPPVSFNSFDALLYTGAPFTATGHLQVIPNIVRAGETVRVYWNAVNAASCAVEGTNTDAWSTVLSGSPGKTTSPITAQTTYTLTCRALPGATPAVVTESATANIIPAFQEK